MHPALTAGCRLIFYKLQLFSNILKKLSVFGPFVLFKCQSFYEQKVVLFSPEVTRVVDLFLSYGE
jgi:hypothetical protein